MSPKREVLLEMIVTLRIPDMKRRKVIVGMGKTRWSERDVAFEHFYLAIPFIAEALEIMNGTHPDLPSFDAIYTKGWEATKNEATANLKAVTSFEFLIGLIGIYRFLHPLTGITTRLQGRSMDIVRGFQDVKSCIDELKDIRNDIDTNFAILYRQAERLADQLNVEASIPRLVMRQQHRNNVPAENPQEYYRRAFCIPFYDRLIAEMELRFSKMSITASKFFFLVPSVLCAMELKFDTFSGLLELYANDLFNVDALDMEINAWKNKWLKVDKSARPDSLAKCLKVIDEERFPNLFDVIKIGATIPLSSCECERSFSTLRRLRTWLRSSMKTSRLTSLALMNIHYSAHVDYKEVVKTFLEKHPRKIDVSNLIYE